MKKSRRGLALGLAFSMLLSLPTPAAAMASVYAPSVAEAVSEQDGESPASSNPVWDEDGMEDGQANGSGQNAEIETDPMEPAQNMNTEELAGSETPEEEIKEEAIEGEGTEGEGTGSEGTEGEGTKGEGTEGESTENFPVQGAESTAPIVPPEETSGTVSPLAGEENSCGENLTWTLADNGVLTISGTGEMTNFNDSTDVPWSASSTTITSVVINDGVSSIGNYAFLSCDKLTSVTLPDGLVRIGVQAFDKCTGLTAVEIPSTVTEIGNYAFRGCTGLTDVIILDGVTKIGNSAFYNCTGLTAIEIPSTVTEIGNSAFYGCTGLTVVEIPGTVTEIGNSAFCGCTGLTDVVILDGITRIGDSAFSECTTLEKVVLPQSVTTFGNSAFECPETNVLTDVFYYGQEEPGVSNDTALDGAYWHCGYTGTNIVPVEAVVAAGSEENVTVTMPFNYVYQGESFPVEPKPNAGYTTSLSVTNGQCDGFTVTVANEGDFDRVIVTVTATPVGSGTVTDSGTSENSNISWCLYDDGSMHITGTGGMSSYDCNLWSKHRDTIQSVVLYEGVTSVGSSAFKNCTNLTEITFPDTITRIEDSAFSGCSSLIEITLPSKLTYIGDNAFYNCTGLTNVIFPDSVTELAYKSFYNCSALEYIVIPEGLTTFGSYVFDSTALTDVFSFDESKPSISSSNSTLNGAYWHCGYTGSKIVSLEPAGESAFTNVTASWPGAYAFQGETIRLNVLPDSGYEVKSVEVTNATVNGSVITLPVGEYDTVTVTNVTVQEKRPNSEIMASGTCSSPNIKWTLYADGKLFLSGYGAMKNYYSSSDVEWSSYCTDITSVSISEGITRVGNYAFYGCTALESVSVPSTVTAIGESAFRNCSSLKTFTIPESVTNVGSYAFSGCTALEWVIIPETAPNFESYAFNNVESAEVFYRGEENEKPSISINAKWHYGYGNESIVTLAMETFDHITTAKSFSKYAYKGETVPISVTPEGGYTASISADHGTVNGFAVTINNTDDFNKVVITVMATALEDGKTPNATGACGDNLTYALYNSEDGTTSELYISGTGAMTNYSYYGSYVAPWKGKAITSVTIGEGVTRIGSYAFYECSTLESITIPNSVTSIGNSAFQECGSLASVTILESVTIIGSSAFQGCSSLTSVTIPEGVTSIDSSTFYGCSALASVTIPASVTSIGNGAFEGCSSLTSVEVPADVTSIGSSTFYGCSALASITIPDGVTSIGYSAFRECSSLTSVKIPADVTSIGESAFYGCSALASVTIPDSVTSIGESAFRECSSLTSITIPEAVTSIDRYTFYKCSALRYVVFLGNLTSIGYNAFNGSGLTDVFWPLESVSSIEISSNNETFQNAYKHNSYKGEKIIEFTSLNPHLAITLPAWFAVPGETISGSSIQIQVAPQPGYRLDGAWTMENATWDETANTITVNNTSDTVYSVTIDGKTMPLREDGEAETGGEWSGEGFQFHWCLYTDGRLLIAGNGAIPDYNNDNVPPWNSYQSEIKTLDIAEGITGIGQHAFSNTRNLEVVILPPSLTSIGEQAFGTSYYYSDMEIFYRGTSAMWEKITIGDSNNRLTNAHRHYGYGGQEFVTVTAENGDDSHLNITVTSSMAYKGEDFTYFMVKPESGYKLENLTADHGTVAEDKASVTISTEGEFDTFTISGTAAPLRSDGVEITDYGDAGEYVTWTRYSDGALYIAGSGNMNDYSYSGASWKWSEITSVTIVEGVTSIGNHAFNDCSTLASVTIPASVTRIGDSAFQECSSLATVMIPEGVTSISTNTFYKCSALASVTIPASVTSIGDSAFQECSSLTSVTIPEKVTSIGNNTFYKCSALASVTIPANVTSMGEGAFQECSSLTSVTIPEKVTSIGNNTFCKCSALASVTIPASVTNIGYNAFSGCSALTSITIPANVSNIGEGTFSGCSALASVTISANVTSIENYVFSGCSALTSITIPASVTNIGEGAFQSCISLTNVTIPENLTNIGDSAFSGCSTLASITIPANVTNIGNYAFSNCSALASVTIPASVTSIGEGVFQECIGLTGVTISEGVTSIGYRAFSDCSALASIIIPASMTSIGSYAFSNCSTLTSVTIPANVTHIGDGAFQSCVGLTGVTISEGVSNIGDNAFGNCSALESITIPASVTRIGDSSFQSCSKLASMEILENTEAPKNAEVPEGAVSIGNYAFSNCSALASVTIPASVASIGSHAFSECLALASVSILANTGSIGNYAFQSCSKLASVEISKGVTSIGNYAFNNCSALASIAIPASVARIGDNAFQSCSSLASAEISEGVTSIGNYAFSNCSALASVTIPASVTSIGDNAFQSCSGLASMKILENAEVPEGTVSIGNYAFSNCSALTGIVIPSSVIYVGNYAFKNCSALAYAVIPENDASFGYNIFTGTSLTDVFYTGESKPDPVMSNDEELENAYWHCQYAGQGMVSLLVERVRHVAVTFSGAKMAFKGETVPIEIIPDAGYKVTNVTVSNGTIAAIGETPPSTFTVDESGDFTVVTVQASIATISSDEIAWSGICGDDLRWCIYGSGELYITGTGEMYDYTDEYFNSSERYDYLAPWYPCRHSITSVRMDDTITSIGDYAFYGCAYLETITVPEKVTQIGMAAFRDCLSLPTVNIPDGITEICSMTFSGCKTLSAVTIPESVTAIGSSAFSRCSGLTKITIPEKVTTIGAYAFRGCSSLTGIQIPAAVTSIERYAFADCSSLKQFTIPTTIKTLSEGVLSGCSGITALTIPANILRIEERAFASTGLTSIVIPDMVPQDPNLEDPIPEDPTLEDPIPGMGSFVFENCKSLTSVTIPATIISLPDGTFYGCEGFKDQSAIKGLDHIERIGSEAFSCCKGLTAFQIPASVTEIGSAAFYECTGLTEMNIPETVTSLGSYVFSNCTGMTSCSIPKSITEIPENMFEGCIGFTEFTIPEHITTIGGAAFSKCEGLTNMVIPESVVTYGKNIFAGCKGLTSVTLPKNLTFIPYGMFRECTGLTEFTISDNILRIRDYAFAGCEGLTEMNIPDSVITIGNEAFERCTSLKTVLLPSSLETIGRYAFSACVSLTALTINCGAVSIGDYAFYECSYLTDLVIGGGINNLGSHAFYGCSRLGSAQFLGDAPYKIGEKAFPSQSRGEFVIYYDATSKGWSTPIWNGYYTTPLKDVQDYSTLNEDNFNAQGIFFRLNPSNLTATVGDRSTVQNNSEYYGQGGTIQGIVVIPDTVKAQDGNDYKVISIGQNAFHGDKVIREVRLGKYVESVDPTAFNGCSSLTKFVVDKNNSYLSVGDGDGLYSFNKDILYAYPAGRTEPAFTVPTTVKSIIQNAFYGSTYLKEVTVGENVTAIEKCAFQNCSQLEKVTLPFIGGSAADENVIDYVFQNTFVPKSYREEMGLPYTLKEIVIKGGQLKEDAFHNAVYLERITLPAVLTSIADRSFTGCTRLNYLQYGTTIPDVKENTLYIPNNIRRIGSEAFYGCQSVCAFEVSERNEKYESDEYGVLYTKGQTELVAYPSARADEYYSLPKTVTSIAYHAMRAPTALVRCSIPAEVTNLPDGCIVNCPNVVFATYTGTAADSYLTGANLNVWYLDDYSVKSLELKCLPDTTIYLPGYEDPSGLEVIATWVSTWNSIQFMAHPEDCSITYDSTEPGERTATVHYESVETTYPVTFLDISSAEVTLHPEGGTLTGGNTVQIELDGKFNLPTPQKENFTFLGWYTADGEQIETGTRVKGEHILHLKDLYAQWLESQTEITLHLNGGTLPDGSSDTIPIEIELGGTFDLPTPQRENLTFLGWYTTNGTDGEQIEVGARVEKEHILHLKDLYAQWLVNQTEIALHPNGGTLPDGSSDTISIGIELGGTFNLPEPQKENFTFLGWYTTNGTDREQIKTGDPVTDEHILHLKDLYAQWLENQTEITLHLNGGTLPDGSSDTISIEIELGGTFNLPEPQKENFIFLGWYTTDGTDGEQIKTGDPVTDEHILHLKDLHAQWQDLSKLAAWITSPTEPGVTNVQISGPDGTLDKTKIAVVYAASYDSNGMMTGIAEGKWNPTDEIVKFEKTLDEHWFIFIMDSESAPLCEKLQLKTIPTGT